MQRTAVVTGGKLRVCLLRLRDRDIREHRHDTVEFRVVLLQTRQIHLCELE